MKKKFLSLLRFTILHLQLLAIGCSNNTPAQCKEAFEYNEKLAQNERFLQMKTCGVGVNDAKKMKSAYDSNILVNQNFVDAIYNELEVVDQVLTSHNIPYTIFGGTMLGAIRNGGFIPNDDDIDILVHEKHENQIINLKAEFDQKGFTLEEQSDKVIIKVYNRKTKTNGLDIFIATPRTIDGQEVLSYRDEGYKKWPKDRVAINAFDFLEKTRFGHLNVSIFSKNIASAYLNSAYGSDWYSITYKTSNHYNGSSFDTRKVELAPQDYFYISHSQHVPK